MMNRKEQNQRHTAFMLLACAFAFVYLLARQFQGSDMVSYRGHITANTAAQTGETKNDPINSLKAQPTSLTNITQSGSRTAIASSGNNISFAPLNALPQSFVRLGITTTQGTLIDSERVIVSNQTNQINRKGERKTFAGSGLTTLGIRAQALTFYNDESWANILVLMEVSANNQSILIQAPYGVYRDNKSHLNTIISQLTQKSN